MDIIFIRELRVETLIGIYAWERQAPQKIELDLEIGLPAGHVARAAASGDVAHTIDYAKVSARIEALLHEKRFPLLESAVEAIAAMVMQEFGAPWVKVSIAKLGGLAGVKKLGLVVERGQRD